MTVLAQPVFWVAQCLTFGALTGIGITIALLVVPEPPAYHRTPNFEFSLPEEWSCDQDGTETVCMPAGVRPADSIIVLAVKYRNEADDRSVYTAHLQKPYVGVRRDGTEFRSEIVHNRKREIAGYEWVDALHFESELPNFYTRYLATTTSHLGLVITFSVHKDAMENRMPAFEQSVRDLRIYQAPSVFN